MEDRTSYLLEQIARSSDEAAYRELYYTCYPSLFRFATTLLHEEQLAEEVVSDVFINIWKGRESLTSVRNLRVYLFVAVKNLCHRALTRRGDAPELLEEAHLTAAIGGGTKADEFLLSKELNHAFELAVASLPERCRLIFRLVREEGSETRPADSRRTVQDALIRSPSGIFRPRAIACAIIRSANVQSSRTRSKSWVLFFNRWAARLPPASFW